MLWVKIPILANMGIMYTDPIYAPAGANANVYSRPVGALCKGLVREVLQLEDAHRLREPAVVTAPLNRLHSAECEIISSSHPPLLLRAPAQSRPGVAPFWPSVRYWLTLARCARAGPRASRSPLLWLRIFQEQRSCPCPNRKGRVPHRPAFDWPPLAGRLSLAGYRNAS